MLPADPEAAPLRGADEGGTSSSGRGEGGRPASAPPPRHRRACRRAATACLCVAVAASGAALWYRTGMALTAASAARLVEGSGGGNVLPASLTATALDAATTPPLPQPQCPPRPHHPHVAAAEWWLAMVAAYPGPALDAARAALAEQDAAEAAAAAARFACLDAAAGAGVGVVGSAAAGLAAAAKAVSPKQPAPPDAALTPALLASVAGGTPGAPSSPISITWCNAAFLPFALNWAAHFRALGHPFLVGASDGAALAGLRAAGVPTFAMPSLGVTSPGDLGWGTPAFHALGRDKAWLAAAVTGGGWDLLLTDTDTVWLRDPGPFLARFPDAAVLTSSDGLHRTTVPYPSRPATPTHNSNSTGLAAAAAALALPGAGDGLEAWPAAGAAAANIGIMLWRSTAHPVAVAWAGALAAEPGAWDQAVFNDLLRAGDGAPTKNATPPPSTGLFAAFGRAAPSPASSLAGILPVDAFASGHTHFVQRLSERTGLGTPFAVHTTFQFSGTPGKRHRLREAWLWAVDGPDHYAPAGGLLTVGEFEADDPAFLSLLARAAAPGTPPPPAAAAAAAAAAQAAALASLAGHFALVNHQLATIRAGLALAAALNRTLVLPRLWCGADRWWQPHAGVIPGSTLPARLPFRCPADHILDVGALVEGTGMEDASVHGPHIPVREAGLTANPRFPAAHRARGPAGTLAVVVGGGGGGGERPAGDTLTIPAGLDDAGLRAALAGASATPVLHFSLPTSLVGDTTTFFRDPAVAAAFGRRAALAADMWCCVPGATPGHVWYDAQAGEPHTDRHGRAWRGGAWVPTLGP